MKQNSPELGKLISGEGFRDAIHVAVAPAVAASRLYPGQRVGKTAAGTFGPVEPHVGIVDPFLLDGVLVGEKFWLLLFPGTITSLRHEWEHPLFKGEPTTPAKSEAREIIEYGARIAGLSYERMLEVAEEYAESGECMHMGENERYKEYEYGEEFWNAFKELTGKALPEYKCAPFSCAC